jgi:hypothetical protein
MYIMQICQIAARAINCAPKKDQTQKKTSPSTAVYHPIIIPRTMAGWLFSDLGYRGVLVFFFFQKDDAKACDI